MEILKVLVISIVQGVAEFLPISSSGHILLLKRLFHLNFDMSFDLTIHFGTLFSVLFVYHKDISELLKGAFQKSIYSTTFGKTLTQKEIFRIYWMFILATLPAGLIGFIFKDKISAQFTIGNSRVFFLLALLFAYTALLLLSTIFVKYQKTNTIDKMTFFQAMVIGIFQAVAILPGVSRSGSTISGALFSRVDRKDAGRFSFLLSVPLIFAAFLLEILDIISGNLSFAFSSIPYYLLGFLFSFLSGYISLKLLIGMINRGKIWFFSFYLIIPIVLSGIFGILG